MKYDELDCMDLAKLQQAMEQAVPFNHMLGLKCELLERGRAIVLVPFKDHLIGDKTRPALHGGVLSAASDASMGTAVFSLLRPGDTCSTVDLRIDYLRPGLPMDVRCEATVLRLGSRVAVASARLYQDGDREIAIAKGVFMVKPRLSEGRDESIVGSINQ